MPQCGPACARDTSTRKSSKMQAKEVCAKAWRSAVHEGRLVGRGQGMIRETDLGQRTPRGGCNGQEAEMVGARV